MTRMALARSPAGLLARSSNQRRSCLSSPIARVSVVSVSSAESSSKAMAKGIKRHKIKLSPGGFQGILSVFMKQVIIGMIGGGTVGSGVFHAWQTNGDLMASRLGVKINFRRVAVKALDEPRPYPIPDSLMTTDWQLVVNDPEIQIVIELVGGTGIAKTMILAALAQGKTVITANKALLSAHGRELFAAAARHGANLYYEASVCGGIPIIKSLREGFVANQFPAIYGIVNGTCNYILTRMKQEGAEFADVLADAQKQGYAETPPDLDIDGNDAQHKIGILASLRSEERR